MIAYENIEAPGFRPPKLLTYIDPKTQALYEYHEELQEIRKMTYDKFSKFKEMSDEEKYRFIYSKSSFLEFKKKSPRKTPTR